MPSVTYGGSGGQQVELEVDPDLLVVRTLSRRSLWAGPVAGPEAAVVDGLDLVAAYPEAGVEVYRRSEGSPGVPEMKSALAGAPDVEFAGRVLVDPVSRRPVLYTENLFVKFADDLLDDECRQHLADAGLTVKRKVDYATNAYVASAPEGTGQDVFAIAERLLASDDVELCHPELIREQGRRALPAPQWHLHTTVIAGQTIDASANVEAAHTMTRGAGVVIAVIDDGVDIDHEELASAGKIVAPRDVTSNDSDPRPARSGDAHGTACAGVACADGRFQASGVAPDARLMPIRFTSALGSQAEADAFAWAADHGADVISCSWGPMDGRWFDPADPTHNQVVPLPDSTRLAIDHATTRGRGGKGCVVLFAAGNGNELVANDGYASYGNVLAVAACNDRGRRSVYSDTGPAVFCAFPSNDVGWPAGNHPAPLTPGIFTIDPTGPRGDAAGGYRNDFGGTSSACPGAAGVVALVLSARPELTRLEVRDILARSCVRIDPGNGAYGADGRSPWYGFGRLDAAEAVRLARLHGTTSDVIEVNRSVEVAIPDLGRAETALEVAADGEVTEARVTVGIEHTWIGDLVVTLVPPAGSGAGPVVLHDRRGGSTHDLRTTYTSAQVPALANLVGSRAAGTWRIEVRDAEAGDVGVLRSAGIRLVVTRAQPTPGAPTSTPSRSTAGPDAGSNGGGRSRARRPAAAGKK